MRIALLSAEYPPTPGGVGDYTERLATALVARGDTVTVLTGAAPGTVLAASDTAKGHTVLRLPTNWGWNCWRAVSDAVRHLRCQVVHLQFQTGAYRQHPAIHLLPWWLKRQKEAPRVVVTAHDLLLPYLFPRADLLRRWLMRRLLHDADATIVTNAEDADRLRGQQAGDRQHFADRGQAAYVIPIGSNIAVAPPVGYRQDVWRARLGIGNHPVVAYFGLMNATKGLLFLVQAVALLDPETRLLVIGGTATTDQERTYARQVEETAATLGLSSRIHTTGRVPPEEVSAYLLMSDVVALPFTDGVSYRRGSLLAALAHGVPVVTTQPVTPLDPPLLDRVAARLVPPHDPPALAAAIHELLEDADGRHRLATGGRALAAHFDWSSIAATHEVVYNSLVLSTEC